MASLVITVDYSDITVKYGRDKLSSAFSGTETGSKESVLPSEQEAGVDSSALSVAENTALVKTSVTTYPMLHNSWGGYVIGSLPRLSDTSDPNYIWARMTPKCYIQMLGFLSPTGRSGSLAPMKDIHNSNPLFFAIWHYNHLSTTPAYRETTLLPTRWAYYIMQRYDRADALVYNDVDDAPNLINGNETSETAYVTEGVTPNFVNANIRNDLAEMACDGLTGSNLSGFGFGDGDDVSEWNSWYHDSTPLRFFGTNKKLTRPFTNGLGTVVSVTTSSGKLTSATITNQPGPSCVGQAVFFFPHNDPKKFVGYEITGYSDSGGNAILNLALPGNADSQTYTPAANHIVCITDRDNETGSADWNADGTSDGDGTNAASIWCPKWIEYFDEINTFVLAQSGHETGAGWNGIARSFTDKDGNGWTVPHHLSGSADYCTHENFFSLTMKFGRYTQDSPTPHSTGYDIANFDPLMCQRGLHFAGTFVKTPNSFMANKPRGSGIETHVWGENYNDVNALDATVLRHHLALVRTAPNLSHIGIMSNQNAGCHTDEHFLDFDTNYSTVEPLVTYTEDGGGTGSDGPIHLAVWKTPQAGERIFVRRLGNFLVIINCADFPNDYPSYYAPSHLAGGYTPRATDDEITPSEWSSIISTYSTGGETLRYFDADTYVNQRVTTYVRSQAPNVWGSSAPGGPYNWGPRQVSPFDSDGAYTLANCPAFARDTINDGTTVNTGASLLLGPQESLFLEIV